MKIKQIIFISLAISISALSGFFIGQKNDTTVAQTKSESIDKLFNILKKENIKVVRRFEDGKQTAILRQLNTPVEKNSILKTSEKLSIYNKEGKEIFSKTDFLIGDFYFSNLAGGSKQLVIETNGGGTDDFLEIYDLKNGKFEEIINPFETQMRGGYWIMPEYRSGVKSPYFKPSQIFVINQIGGADENPSATIFRLNSGKYKPVGTISMQELGDFIEKQISKPKNAEARTK